MLCKFHLRRFSAHSQSNRTNSLEEIEEIDFSICGKEMEHLENAEILCVHRSKTLIALGVQEF